MRKRPLVSVMVWLAVGLVVVAYLALRFTGPACQVDQEYFGK